MDTLEREIREALDRKVGAPPARQMPKGTRSRVRGRQVRWIAAVTVVAVGVGFGGFAVLKSIPGHGGGPGDGGTQNAAPDDPLEFVPKGWPTVVIGDPADGYTVPPDVAEADGPVRVIASGTVDGKGFSFQSYVGIGPDPGWKGPCLGFAGPGLDQFASPDPQPPGAVGGVSSQTCANVQGVPGLKDMFLTAQEDPEQAPGIAPNYGFLSSRVDGLELRLADGSTYGIVVLPSPPGWDGVQAFFFVPPQGVTGTVVALAADGTELARAQACTYDEASAFGCGGGGGVTQLAPIPGPSASG
jgi:hypothetical protein